MNLNQVFAVHVIPNHLRCAPRPEFLRDFRPTNSSLVHCASEKCGLSLLSNSENFEHLKNLKCDGRSRKRSSAADGLVFSRLIDFFIATQQNSSKPIQKPSFLRSKRRFRKLRWTQLSKSMRERLSLSKNGNTHLTHEGKVVFIQKYYP